MKIKTKLLPYQQSAYEKLGRLKIGALYMDMGVGKTRTMIEIIIRKLSKNKIDHILWLCPVSTITNLKTDIEKHTDGLIDKISIIGIESLSQSDREYLKALDIVENNKCMLIVDESHKVKNWFAKRTKRSIRLSECCTYKYLLTGTPVTKNETDLFSQWYILDKRIFGYRSYDSFCRNHLELDENNKVVRVLNVEYLTRKMEPYTYIIKKEDIDIDLKRKIYETFHFELNIDQIRHYKEVKNKMLSFVDEEEWDENIIFRVFTALQLISSGRYIISPKKHEKLEHRPMFENPLYNPRIDALRYLIEDEEEKVIIWCKYQFEIEDVETLLLKLNKKYTLLHGNININKRNKNIKAFKNDVQFLVANMGVGGTGLNLQFAHKAIYYSNSFDWGNKSQSEDRLHRIGQNKDVHITDLYSTCSIDKIIEKNLENKESISYCINRFLKDKKLFKDVI